MRIHLIAIGGSIMHNLAISLKLQGHEVSGSDDSIYNPASDNLKQHNLFPKSLGWNEEVITSDLDLVIAGMHAKADNPELKKAQSLGLKIQSFPEFIAAHSTDKKRIVVAGSHGKTTTTSMIMYVLKQLNLPFDYLVGAQLKGYETMVGLSDAPIMIIEGDEYLTSALDRRSKFLWYNPDIAIITGIAWDHINVFPTFESYLDTFRAFIEPFDGNKEKVLICNLEDEDLKKITGEYTDLGLIPYNIPEYVIKDEQVNIIHNGNHYPMNVFGQHNLQNMLSAAIVCEQLGISKHDFYTSIRDFSGASKRLELLLKNENLTVYRDFAHAPSKVKASVKAVRELFSEKKFVAILELHTYSSLEPNFLPQYAESLNPADEAYVYISEHALTIKNKTMPEKEWVESCFKHPNLTVFTTPSELEQLINVKKQEEITLLLMSSGSFDKINFETLLG